MNLAMAMEHGAELINEFNLQLSVGRYGVLSPKAGSLEDDVRRQLKLVVEERVEFSEAITVVHALKEAIDMLVTEVWLEVLKTALPDSGLSIEEASRLVSAQYGRPTYSTEATQHLQYLAWLGCDVYGALKAVCKDNEAKFHTEVAACAATTRHWTDNGVPCTAAPVDAMQQKWGVFRDADKKLLKPRHMLMAERNGQGLSLEQFVPNPLWSVGLTPMWSVLDGTGLRRVRK